MGSRSSTAIGERLPLVTLGDYDPDARRGPGVLGALRRRRHGRRSAFRTGRRSSTCRASAAARCGRSTRARRSWRRSPSCSTAASGSRTRTAATGRSARCSSTRERGLGLRVADDAETQLRRCCSRSDRLLDEPVDRAGEAAARRRLLPRPGQPRSRPEPARLARRSRRATARGSTTRSGRRSCSSARPTTASIRPSTARSPRRASSGTRKGTWAQVWKRFAETPERYPGIPEQLRKAQPLRAHRRATWMPGRRTTRRPRTSSATACATSRRSPPRARARRSLALEAEHAWRRGTVWADLGPGAAGVRPRAARRRSPS